MAEGEKKDQKPPQSQTHLPPLPPPPPYTQPDCNCEGNDGNLQHFGKPCYSCWLKQQPFGGFGICPPPPSSCYGSVDSSSNYGSSGSGGIVFYRCVDGDQTSNFKGRRVKCLNELCSCWRNIHLNHYDPYWTTPDHRRISYGWCEEDNDEDEEEAGNPFKGKVTGPPVPKARPHREGETRRKPNVFKKFKNFVLLKNRQTSLED